ncbi:SDR family oxidoreductase [Oceanibacterium hippocampi]|uniref:Gluconate 5-dehydrogenase n=1 Tax=Oceanibacterium hippocampi TaxID=745714 RepID=A0A1Y5T918_9PROT|nr:SDR family oxidoreductase [Oceanibacterium hippocampi]SLN55054.1 Gluconate 5-dehydrogenase [Oceanibacterium hippocampi]
MTNPFRLDGKTALVTGASSGLGWRFAQVLARAGAHVGITARRTDRLEELATEIRAFDGRAMPFRMDVTDNASIEAAVEAVETELGPIDILINNSGVSREGLAVDLSEDDYDFVMNTNVKGAFFVAQAVAKRMIPRGRGGRIVNIASIAGLRTLPTLSVYCMSKAAVIHMTRSLAHEWTRYGINVNAICPGYVETEMNRDYWETEGGRKLISKLPRRRLGNVDDLDGALMLMVAEESRFINGAILPVDDGLTVML